MVKRPCALVFLKALLFVGAAVAADDISQQNPQRPLITVSQIVDGDYRYGITYQVDSASMVETIGRIDETTKDIVLGKMHRSTSPKTASSVDRYSCAINDTTHLRVSSFVSAIPTDEHYKCGFTFLPDDNHEDGAGNTLVKVKSKIKDAVTTFIFSISHPIASVVKTSSSIKTEVGGASGTSVPTVTQPIAYSVPVPTVAQPVSPSGGVGKRLKEIFKRKGSVATQEKTAVADKPESSGANPKSPQLQKELADVLAKRTASKK